MRRCPYASARDLHKLQAKCPDCWNDSLKNADLAIVVDSPAEPSRRSFSLLQLHLNLLSSKQLRFFSWTEDLYLQQQTKVVNYFEYAAEFYS